MRNCLVILLSVLFGSDCINAQNVIKYDAFTALDIEKQEGFRVTDTSYNKLREIYAKMDESVLIPEPLSKEQALAACREMSRILEENFGIKYGITMLLSEGLRNNQLDCNFYSVVLCTYLKSKKQRAEVLITPGHMFLRWYYSDSLYINYETTTGVEHSDNDYISNFHISETAIKNNLYMKPLSPSQILACAYIDMSCKFLSNTVKQRALLNKSLKLFPNLVMAMGNLAHCSVAEGKTGEAISIMNKAIRLDSLNYVTYQQAGKIYRYAKKYSEAINYFTKGIELNPEDPQSYVYRSNCYLDINNVDAAMGDFEKGAELLKSDDIFKFLFDYICYHALEDRIMDAYLKNK